MKITDLRVAKTDLTARLSANVIWEDSNRAPIELYFEIPGEFADALSVNANAFLVAAIFPAMEAGEKRIAIEGEICPRVRAGLLTILDLFQYWYGRDREMIAIEGKAWSGESVRRTPERAGSFFTGGIDSLATMRRNRLLFPETHPESLKDTIILYGINFDSDDSPLTFSRAVQELSAVADAAAVKLIPVSTNCRRDLHPGGTFFSSKFHAALLAATAHALNARLTTMSIASSYDIPNLTPWGSHPLVDPNFSSAGMRIYHDSLELSRFAKTKLVAEWDVGLQNIKVCTVNWPGVNCERCEKCLRTMLALLALGVLDRSKAFAARNLTEEAVRAIRIDTTHQTLYYAELIDPLRAAGRADLARGIEYILARYRGEFGLLGPLKRIDRLHFGNSFRMLKKNCRGRSVMPGRTSRSARTRPLTEMVNSMGNEEPSSHGLVAHRFGNAAVPLTRVIFQKSSDKLSSSK